MRRFLIGEGMYVGGGGVGISGVVLDVEDNDCPVLVKWKRLIRTSW